MHRRSRSVLLALLALPLALLRNWPRWRLLAMFAATSAALAGLANFQAGGNINYYFEALFALVPFATYGVFRAETLSARHVAVGLFLAAAFAIHVVPPQVQAALRDNPIEAVARRNEAFRAVERPLRHHRLLATVPRFALLDPRPDLVEPYLMSYLRRMGKANGAVVVDAARRAEYRGRRDTRQGTKLEGGATHRSRSAPGHRSLVFAVLFGVRRGHPPAAQRRRRRRARTCARGVWLRAGLAWREESVVANRALGSGAAPIFCARTNICLPMGFHGEARYSGIVARVTQQRWPPSPFAPRDVLVHVPRCRTRPA